jgi:hypothetical protein
MLYRLISESVSSPYTKKIVLRQVFYGCENVPPPHLREKHAHKRRVSDKRMRRKIFVLKKAEVTGIQKKTTLRGAA